MCIFSWSLCAISCRVLCAVLYVHLLMTLLFLCASSDSYGRRAELARTALFPTPCGWTMMRKFAVASKRKRISILFPKRCFRMGPMSLTSICNIMLLTGFFESSKSHLSSGRRDRSCSSTEELWCIGAIRDCDDKGFIYFAKSQRTAFMSRRSHRKGEMFVFAHKQAPFPKDLPQAIVLQVQLTGML